MADKKELYSRTKESWPAIVRFIAEYKQSHGGQSPSYREIGNQVGHASTSVISYTLREMAQAGLVALPDEKRRRIDLPGEAYIPPPGLDEKTEMV